MTTEKASVLANLLNAVADSIDEGADALTSMDVHYQQDEGGLSVCFAVSKDWLEKYLHQWDDEPFAHGDAFIDVSKLRQSGIEILIRD